MGGALELQASLRGHRGVVWCVAWSPRGLLASCGADKSVLVWQAVRHRPPPGDDSGSAAGPAAAGERWQCTASLSGNSFLRTVRCVAWGVDGRSLAAGSFDATATVLELVGGKAPRLEAAVSLEGHESEVKSLSYSSSGGLLASASRDRSVWIWEVGFDFDYECIAVLNGHTADVKCVRWHPSSEMLVSCGYDNDVRVWVEDEDDWFCLETLSAHDSTVWSLAFDKTGQHLVSVGDGGAVVIWRRTEAPGAVVGGHPRYTVAAHLTGVHDGPIYAVDWAAGSGLIATCGDDDCIRVLRRDGGGGGSAADEGEDDADDAAGAPAAGDGEATKLRTETDQVWAEDGCAPRAHSGSVNCVVWSPAEAATLASAGDDGLVRIWKYRAGEATGA
jgi:cytosolic iron-sulfur protein assembly protein CIAO1